MNSYEDNIIKDIIHNQFTEAFQLTPKSVFISYHGVLTISYKGWTNGMVRLKETLNRSTLLTEENSGTKWPKTTIACLKDNVHLSYHQYLQLYDKVDRLSKQYFNTCDDNDDGDSNTNNDHSLKTIDMSNLSLVSFHNRALISPYYSITQFNCQLDYDSLPSRVSSSLPKSSSSSPTTTSSSSYQQQQQQQKNLNMNIAGNNNNNCNSQYKRYYDLDLDSVQYVHSVIDEPKKIGHEEYYRKVQPSSSSSLKDLQQQQPDERYLHSQHHQSYYVDPVSAREKTLVCFLNNNYNNGLLSIFNTIQKEIEKEFPGLYYWFPLDTLHISIRSIIYKKQQQQQQQHFHQYHQEYHHQHNQQHHQHQQ